MDTYILGCVVLIYVGLQIQVWGLRRRISLLNRDIEQLSREITCSPFSQH